MNEKEMLKEIKKAERLYKDMLNTKRLFLTLMAIALILPIVGIVLTFMEMFKTVGLIVIGFIFCNLTLQKYVIPKMKEETKRADELMSESRLERSEIDERIWDRK